MARSRATAGRAWRLPSFSNISFMLVFLGLPLAVYVIFVISPFVQAFYYSMTDWSGFSRKMNFVGLDNYVRLLGDGVFLKALANSIVLVVILPPVVIVLSMTLATLVTVGGVLLASRGSSRDIGAGPGPACALPPRTCAARCSELAEMPASGPGFVDLRLPEEQIAATSTSSRLRCRRSRRTRRTTSEPTVQCTFSRR